ncbi:hypothetical protein [Arsenophonus endosymbiont of Bemisia tabaci]|uniref:hypothetical protein n=1 Tax=Arsenophonus endosymbiont of Bemisia tabaci TaxID=536059 RepID=UPI0015F3D871|nr:hypothetical protein [Arsenophonus endosymbiont of Bemisia tabaci]CAA2931169.1 hypothetical protein ARSQ2_02320 [Arsenophonus endosymbiont of Bemisia tabaci Q2]
MASISGSILGAISVTGCLTFTDWLIPLGAAKATMVTDIDSAEEADNVGYNKNQDTANEA